jgi:uncharacterized membrane protein
MQKSTASLTKFVDSLRVSLWTVPTIMAVASAVLAHLMVWVDNEYKEEVAETFGWIYAGGADGAREVLSTIAGSMITIAGVVFSITIVSLSLASQQYGPHMLRNFMRDRGNQLVLGTFVSTFIFCLLVLRTVRGEDGEEFVPYVSVTFGVLLAIASIGVLIYFIHHIASSIVVNDITKAISVELKDAMNAVFPEHIGRGEEEAETPPVAPEQLPQGVPASICAVDEGYLVAISDSTILELARTRNVLFRILVRPGRFVMKQSRIVEVYPGTLADEAMSEAINEAFAFGKVRTPSQDIGFPISQLVELAVRSMSTGINDPFSAAICAERLAAAMAELGNRRWPSKYRFDEDDTLRVIAEPLSYEQIVDEAFDQLREEAAANRHVAVHTIRALGEAARIVTNHSRSRHLLHHAQLMRRAALHQIEDPDSLRRVEEAYMIAVREQ